MSLLLLSFILSLSSLHTLYAQESNSTVYCGPYADTSVACPDVSDPVCAPYPRYCISTPCPQVMEFYNGCVACQDPTVTSYTLGRCVYTCATGELNQDGKVVCAIYQEGCQDDSCRREFQDSYTACQDPAVISYTIESCPVSTTAAESAEAELLPITIESTAPIGGVETVLAIEESVNEEQELSALGVIECPVVSITETVACTEQYEPVCAYHYSCVGEDCTGVTVANSCLACMTYAYDYYLDGACEMGGTDSGLLADPTEDWNAQ